MTKGIDIKNIIFTSIKLSSNAEINTESFLDKLR